MNRPVIVMLSLRFSMDPAMWPDSRGLFAKFNISRLTSFMSSVGTAPSSIAWSFNISSFSWVI